MGHKLLSYEFCKTNKTRRFPGSVFAVLFLAACLSTPCRASSVSVVEYYHTLHQHFYCTAEYVPSDCARHLGILQRLLNQYHAENLGEWRWVLVSKTRWKLELLELGFHTSSPAMTSFIDRETLLDESLFSADAERVTELEHQFRVPWQGLLMLAITHELGHATCRDTSEVRAELFAERLRRGLTATCDP